jgi:hypothetical protein
MSWFSRFSAKFGVPGLLLSRGRPTMRATSGTTASQFKQILLDACSGLARGLGSEIDDFYCYPVKHGLKKP